MTIIIGLGNPGTKYKKTRHNIGFRVADEFYKRNNFPEFELSKKFKSLISESKKIILAKPQSFMNQSGKAVKSLIGFYKPESFIVIHDDIDLAIGKIRISKSRGSAGHKGVESIISEIGNKDFIRFRLGIQSEKGKPRNPEKFVLQEFTKEEEKIIKEIIKKSAEAIKFLITNDLEKTMSKYNKQKGFLTIIALLIVVLLIALMIIIVFNTNLFVNKKSQPSNLQEIPKDVEKELKEIQEKYQNNIKE